MSTNNETRFEQVGGQQVKFERMGDTWRVSSHEIARVFGKDNHGAMIRDMKKSHGDNWNAYLAVENIVKSSYTIPNGNKYAEYLFDLTALEYFTSNFRKGTPNKDNMLQTIYKMQGHKTVFEEMSRPEIPFRDDLKAVLDVLNIECVFQHYIAPYFVDIYLPKHNIFVEYDEVQHNATQDDLREGWIQGREGGVFVRCSYKDSNLTNIDKVIKAIYSK